MSSSNSDSPAWTKCSGLRRVVAEFRSLNKQLSSYGFIKDLSLASDDNPMLWRIKLHNFDAALPGGRQLNKDLQELNRLYGQDHISLELEFPPDYPSRPFFARVVSPRCVLYTGHVSAGGSICLEALTTSGTPGSWQSSFTVEALLNVIMVNMIDTPVMYIQTPTGPGGVTGPLRIEFRRGNPCKYSGYSSSSARAAFSRTVENHKQMGWPAFVMYTTQVATRSDSASSSAASGVVVSAPSTAAASCSSSSSSATSGLRNRGLLGFLMTPNGFRCSRSSSAAVERSPAGGAGNSSSSSSSRAAANVAVVPGSVSMRGLADSTENGVALIQRQQPTAAAEVLETRKPPRVQLEFDYPENWDHSVPMVNNTVRLVELPLPADIGSRWNRRQMTPSSSSTGHNRTVFWLKDGPITNSAPIYPAASFGAYVPTSSPTNQVPMFVTRTLLPATTGCSSSIKPLDLLEAAAQQNHLAAADIQTLVRHCPCATEKDVKAALLLSEGDLDGAAVVIATTQEYGGAARRWREMFGDVAGASGDRVDAVPSDQAAVSAEVESLLQHMEAGGGDLIQAVRNCQVVKIERVQHPQLWLKYCIRRAELEVANGTQGINEQLLYHGTSSTVADIIIREGFDIRMANAGSYGRGTYFSNNSSTAVGYCQSKDRYSLHRRAADSSTAVYKLLVARVALGRQCQGSSGCTKPGAGFDSMNGHNATSHVVFDNHQAYPEYVITLKQFICRQ